MTKKPKGPSRKQRSHRIGMKRKKATAVASNRIQMPPGPETWHEYIQTPRGAHEYAMAEHRRRQAELSRQQRAELEQNRAEWALQLALLARLHEDVLTTELHKSRAILRNHFGFPPQ